MLPRSTISQKKRRLGVEKRQKCHLMKNNSYICDAITQTHQFSCYHSFQLQDDLPRTASDCRGRVDGRFLGFRLQGIGHQAFLAAYGLGLRAVVWAFPSLDARRRLFFGLTVCAVHRVSRPLDSLRTVGAHRGQHGSRGLVG